MAPVIAYTLPTMQLVCNLVMSDAPVWNDTSTGPIANETTSEIPSATIPAGYTAFPDLGVAYKVYMLTNSNTANWKAARSRCLEEGARLAVPSTFLKFEALMSTTHESGLNARLIHVGIHSMYDNKEWVSNTDGSTITTVPWATGNPVTTGTVNTCVAASSSPRGLRNIGCSLSLNYACEVPISRNYTTQKSMVAEISANET